MDVDSQPRNLNRLPSSAKWTAALNIMKQHLGHCLSGHRRLAIQDAKEAGLKLDTSQNVVVRLGHELANPGTPLMQEP